MVELVNVNFVNYNRCHSLFGHTAVHVGSQWINTKSLFVERSLEASCSFIIEKRIGWTHPFQSLCKSEPIPLLNNVSAHGHHQVTAPPPPPLCRLALNVSETLEPLSSLAKAGDFYFVLRDCNYTRCRPFKRKTKLWIFSDVDNKFELMLLIGFCSLCILRLWAVHEEVFPGHYTARPQDTYIPICLTITVISLLLAITRFLLSWLATYRQTQRKK